MINGGDRVWNDFVAPFRKIMHMENYEMHYIDMGQGIPVIMIHGGVLSNYTWKRNVRELIESEYRVIMIDLPGHGRTPIPPESFIYSVENLSNEISILARKLKIEESYLVGHSIGAVCALYMSMNDYINVNKTIVINPPAFGPPHRLLLTYPGMGYLSSMIFGEWTMRMYIKAMYHDENKASTTLIDEYAIPTTKPGFWKMFSKLSKQCFSTKFEEMKNDYQSSSVSVLIIWGEKDRWLKLKTGVHLNDNISNSQMITIPDCGHNPHEECFEQANPLILDFLNNN